MAQRHFEELEDSMEMSQAPALASIQAVMASAASTMQLRPVVATVVESAAATAALPAPKSPPAFVNPCKLDLGGSILALSAHSTVLSASALKKFQLAFIKCENELEREWVKGDVNEAVNGGVKQMERSAMEDIEFAEEEKMMKADAAALQVPSLASLKKRKAAHFSEALQNQAVADVKERAEREDEFEADNEADESGDGVAGGDVDELGEAEACALSRRFVKSNAKRRRIRKDANGRSFIEMSMSSVPPLHVLAQMNGDTSEEVAAYALARNLVDFGEQFLKEEKEFRDAHKKTKTVYKKVSKPAMLSANSPASSVVSLDSDLESLPLSDELPLLSMLSDVSTPGSDSDERDEAEGEGIEDENGSDVEDDGSSSLRDDASTPFPFFDPAMSDVRFPYSPINAEHVPFAPSLDMSAPSGALLDDSYSFSLADLSLPAAAPSLSAFPQSSPKASPRASPTFSFAPASLFQPLSSPTAFALSRAPSIGMTMSMALESVH